MNRLRSHKFKLNTDAEQQTNNINNNNNNNNNNMCNGDNQQYTEQQRNKGLFTKLTKRYSTLSSKITRRHLPGGRKSTSPQKVVVSGSYDMTGAHSDDHRLEIGAPILISTTTLDTDRFGVTEARLKQIGGGIAATSSIVLRSPPPPMTSDSAQSSPQIPSSGSENEVFVDALCETPAHADDDTLEIEHFETPFETPTKRMMSSVTVITNKEPELMNSDNGEPASDATVMTPLNPLENYYETAKAPRRKPKLNKQQHSKSAQNLHRSELKVYLQKAPSMELGTSCTAPDLTYLPKLPELFGTSKCSLAATDTTTETNVNRDNASPCGAINVTTLTSKSEPNTPMCPVDQKVCGFLTQQTQFKSIDSLNIYQRHQQQHSTVFASNMSIDQLQPLGSKQSLASQQSQFSHNSTLADFDMKSVSCQSLNAQQLFVSIDELNEITRQINESEEFNREIDLEYCLHRDQLKPNERRITLLKNKNARLISFNNNKEKIKKSWNGMKHWIGEESTRLKEAVQKQPVLQPALQRIGASKLNLNQSITSECRNSPMRNGSELGSVVQEHDKSLQETEISQHNLNMSCDTIDDNVPDELDSTTSPRAPTKESSPLTKRLEDEGQNGFEELRRFVKQGGDFSKELILVLQERVDSELIYSKSLSKMANKLNKASRELPGSIAESWRGVATEMETRSDIHRQLAASLTDEIVKPLKTIVDSHHKARKSVESNVDKASRTLAEWRVSEAKAKKSSHTAARENEKLQDAMLDVRIQKSPSIALLHQGPNKVAAEKEIKSAEKDCAKLDNKRKKAEEAVKRADVEYYTLCVRAERARVDWEMAVLRGSSLLQNIENQRLLNMKNFVSNYGRLTADMNPILNGLLQNLQPQIEACNVVKDMQVIKNIRRNSEGPSEQLLPDFYCEHTTLAMNRERRKHALIKLLQLVKSDLERERRSRNGLKGLSQSLSNKEHQNITDKLYHIRSMLTYLEGARFKLHSALLELDHKPRSSHPLAQHIQITRDRTGLQQSILKVPLWLKNNDQMNTSTLNIGEDCSRESSNYECSISQVNGSNANISCCTESLVNNKDALIKSFNRSKSNIETFSTKTQQICVVGTKTKTAHLNEPYSDRGQADGGSNQQDSDFDEFSSQDDDDDEQTSSSTRKEHILHKIDGDNIILNGGVHNNDTQHQHHFQNSTEIGNNSSSDQSNSIVLGRCKALYSYTPKLYDELELNPGDIIEVHAKQEDGWWLGALGKQIGIFPATYVEEFS